MASVRYGLLALLLLTTISLSAAPVPELLVQHIDLNEPTVQAKGKVSLRSLKPLAWELELSRYNGDPKPLAKTMALISNQAAKALNDANLAWIRIEGLHGLFEQGNLNARLPRLELPEGGVRQVTAQWNQGGRWSLTAKQGSLRHVPITLLQQLALQPMAFADLDAHGSAIDGSGTLNNMLLPGLKAKRARFDAQLTERPKTKGDPQPTRVNLSLDNVTLEPSDSWIPELLKNLGLQATTNPFALTMTFAAIAEPGRVRLENLDLTAPMTHTRGRIELLPQENPPLLLVDLHTQPHEGKPQRVVKRIPLQAAGS